MKALTLHQPWASLIALGIKTIETRSWSTNYRGPIAIHAGLRPPENGGVVGTWHTYAAPDRAFMGSHEGDDVSDASGFVDLPLGAVVATASLVDCVPMVDEIPPQEEWREPWACLTLQPWLILNRWPGFGSADGRYAGGAVEMSLGDYAPGRWAWLLDDIRPLSQPVPAQGHQRLWNVESIPLGAAIAAFGALPETPGAET